MGTRQDACPPSLETGTTYRINVGLPVGGELASGVAMFCVRDDRLVLLRDQPDRPTAYEFHGTWGARKIEYASAAPPEEGEGIY